MSGREWSKVSPALWRSPRFLGLQGSDERLLLVYYMTGDHMNSSGCYRLPDGYAIADLGWTLERYRTARDLLVAAGLISFDRTTEEVFVNRWFKHNPPTNAKHAKGARRLINKIDSDDLRLMAEEEFCETDWGGQSEQVVNSEISNHSRLASTPILQRVR
ncbi:hypothetical protein [Mesorhizobium muleiense]|uniref:Uncharacterized protein n=1 Tax=Mesorhizobium muleiense TaxID=1004279 RepID=A0A1G8IZM6_9HYPH|nr:hypothetical protein [Mesorhizobium muleiense]MCF6099826.1 hypothetical protein [Mesorhizobium muleiense]SDI24197.1 hypothetical protein SAMN05428953_101534 [Mesorhizobium muleiense]